MCVEYAQSILFFSGQCIILKVPYLSAVHEHVICACSGSSCWQGAGADKPQNQKMMDVLFQQLDLGDG